VVFNHLRHWDHLKDPEVELLEVLLEWALEWNLLRSGDTEPAILVPVGDQLDSQLVWLRQQLLQFESESFGSSKEIGLFGESCG
jgi:hypothetical protein